MFQQNDLVLGGSIALVTDRANVVALGVVGVLWPVVDANQDLLAQELFVMRSLDANTWNKSLGWGE